MTEDEQRFWDAAAIAAISAPVDDVFYGGPSGREIRRALLSPQVAAMRADELLHERRVRNERQKSSTTA